MINNLPERIFLCGFMGAGKSTLGRQLAQRLKMDFLDLDEIIEQESGQSIPEIFEQEGEETFRKQERSAILSITQSKKGVIALGGGSLQNQHVVDHLKLNGLLIFIDTPFSVIFERIAEDSGRPLLTDEQGELKSEELLRRQLQVLYEKRLPFYRQAVITVDASRNLNEVMDQLIRKIENHVTYH